MYESTTQIRVRYGETDQMGFLYYGHYALYYEVGRTDAFRQLGVTYKSMEEMGITMPVIELNSKYLRPAKYDDLLTVKTKIKEWPSGHTITFHTEIFNENGRLLNTGTVTLVFYDAINKKKTTLPENLKHLLSPFFENL